MAQGTWLATSVLVYHLSQGSRLGPSSSGGFQHLGETDALRQEVQQAAERANAATAQADAATTALAEANQKYAHLEEQLKLVQEQLCIWCWTVSLEALKLVRVKFTQIMLRTWMTTHWMKRAPRLVNDSVIKSIKINS